MDLSHLILHMHTTTKFKHNFLSVTLSTVTFVFVHLWKMMKAKVFTMNAFIRMKPSGWNVRISKAEQFFKTCLLPEILGKYYTQPNSNLAQVTDNEQPSICDTNIERLSTSSNSSETSNMGDASSNSSKSRRSNTGDIIVAAPAASPQVVMWVKLVATGASPEVVQLMENSVLVTQVMFLTMIRNQHIAIVMDLTKAR